MFSLLDGYIMWSLLKKNVNDKKFFLSGVFLKSSRTYWWRDIVEKFCTTFIKDSVCNTAKYHLSQTICNQKCSGDWPNIQNTRLIIFNSFAARTIAVCAICKLIVWDTWMRVLYCIYCRFRMRQHCVETVRLCIVLPLLLNFTLLARQLRSWVSVLCYKFKL